MQFKACVLEFNIPYKIIIIILLCAWCMLVLVHDMHSIYQYNIYTACLYIYSTSPEKGIYTLLAAVQFKLILTMKPNTQYH